MTNPDRPAKAAGGRTGGKPFGPTFWKLFTAFILLGSGLAVFLAAYLIHKAVASEEPSGPPPPAASGDAVPRPGMPLESPPGQITPPADSVEDRIYQDESGTWRNTRRGPDPGPRRLEAEPEAPAGAAEAQSPPDFLSLGLRLLAGQGGGEIRPGSASARPAEADRFYRDESGTWRNTGPGGRPSAGNDHIYQDDSGVWRNLSQSSGPDSSGPAPVAANPLAALTGGLPPRAGEADKPPAGGAQVLELLGGLLGTGGESSPAGGDLAALMSVLAGAGGGSSGGGGLSSLLGLPGSPGLDAGGGDLAVLLEGLMSSLGRPDGSGLFQAEEIAPLNITRARPPAPAASGAGRITAGGAGLSLEGYERFDPATAGDIKSEWEYFEDPR